MELQAAERVLGTGTDKEQPHPGCAPCAKPGEGTEIWGFRALTEGNAALWDCPSHRSGVLLLM